MSYLFDSSAAFPLFGTQMYEKLGNQVSRQEAMSGEASCANTRGSL